MIDGLIHHPTQYIIMGDILGETAIIQIPHTLITWSSLGQRGLHIHQDRTQLRICQDNNTTILELTPYSATFTMIEVDRLCRYRLATQITELPLRTSATDNVSTQVGLDLTQPSSSLVSPSASMPSPALLATDDTGPPATVTDTLGHELDSCASTDDSVDDLPEVEMITDFTLPITVHTSSHIRMAWCNISGCDEIQKIERIMALMRVNKLDFLCLTDTRIVSTQWGNALRNAAIQRLGVGSTVDIFTTTKATLSQMHVGGQIIIKSPRIPCSSRSFSDPTGCAVVTGFDIHVGSTDIRIISTYWPGSTGSSHGDSGSLWDKVQAYLHKCKNYTSPLEYIQTYIRRKIAEIQTSNNSLCIIGGDFNATRSALSPGNGVHPPLDVWATSQNLTHVFTKLELAPQPTYYSGVNPKHEIDHIFYTSNTECQPTHGYVLDDVAWAQETDHRPVVADFLIPQFHLPHLSRWKRRRRRAKIVDISRSNQREVTLYQTGMLKRLSKGRDPQAMSADELHRQLLRIHKDTFNIASKICSSPRRKVGNWTPHTIALRTRHGALLSIARITRDMTRTPACLHKKIQHTCARWQHTLSTIRQTSDDPKAWESYLGNGPQYWASLPPWEANVAVTAALRRNRNSLNGRKLTERRQRFLDSLERRKTNRKEGKHLSELKSLLGNPRGGSMLDELEENGKRIIDPLENVHHTTEFFHEWHKKQDIDHGFHAPNSDPARLLSDYLYFKEQHAHTGIPEHLLSRLWSSLRAPNQTLEAQPDKLREFQRAMDTPPSFAEFCQILHHSKRQSSAGMSGVTYNLMSLWPVETAQRVHGLLCAVWTNKSTPSFWKWRWLVPIPKKADNNTLINLRPISLIEASRKLWIGVFVDKIKAFWASTGILCPSQHAYLSNKSTEGALLQFRNTMEETEECATNHYLSSWDIKRAFDRVPKNILTMSWTRLGVPQTVAEYMVGLDTLGTTVIRTPYTERRYRLKGLNTFTTRTPQTPSFKAEVGTGQGDVGSPLNWIAFFDILLCALDSDKRDRPLLRAKGKLHFSRDTGYADDLVSVMTTLAGLQRTADTVSAFAIMFGLDIAVTKLRACKVEWGHEHSQSTDDDTLTVHFFGWKPGEAAQVALSTSRTKRQGGTAEALKYLGVLFDFSNDDSSSFKALVDLSKYIN